jgi:F-type H+-transporting ATPase subunit alpha
MTVAQQVASIFAGTNGYLDEIPAEEVGRFETEFLEVMELKHPDILQEIAEKKDMSEDLTARLKKVLQQFTESFKVSAGA